MSQSTVLPPAVAQLLALYEARLAGVAFADLDLGCLQSAAERYQEQEAEVTKLEADLADARRRANNERSELIALSQKAVAYASVYAADDDELSAQLQALELGRTAARGSRRKTKRRKSAPQNRTANTSGQSALGLEDGAPASRPSTDEAQDSELAA